MQWHHLHSWLYRDGTPGVRGFQSHLFLISDDVLTNQPDRQWCKQLSLSSVAINFGPNNQLSAILPNRFHKSVRQYLHVNIHIHQSSVAVPGASNDIRDCVEY